MFGRHRIHVSATWSTSAVSQVELLLNPESNMPEPELATVSKR